MMAVCNPHLKLSQNERDAILENEKKKWRIFRIQQVRAQGNIEAERLRESAKAVEEKHRLEIADQVKEKWENDKKKRIEELEDKCIKGYQGLGEAHRRAKIEVDAMQAFKDRRLKDGEVAAERGRIALHTMDREKSETYGKENAVKLQKEKVQQRERKRALKIAKLPTPPRFKAQRKPAIKVPKKVMFHEAGTFTTSTYIPSKFRIVKENDVDLISAKESAEKEIEKYEEIEAIKMKKEEEINRKIDERGRRAIERERTKEMYSQLMKDLKEAEENHRLSDFLQGDDDVEGVKAEVLSKNLGEKLAEAKVRDLIDQEYAAAETVPVRLNEKVSKIGNVPRLSEEREIKLSVHDRSDVAEDLGVETDKHQNLAKSIPQAPTKSFPTAAKIAAKDIHLRETVPVHEIPIVKEKFLVRVPDQTTSSSTESETSGDVSKETSKSDAKDISYPPRSSESSFEELKIKIRVNPTSSESISEESSTVVNDLKDTMTSDATQYLKHPEDIKAKYIPKEKAGKRPSESSSSSGVTEYYDVPKSSPSESNFNTIKKNIQSIQERGQRVRKLIDGLKKQDNAPQEKLEKDISAFKTPPRIYTESLKTESSSKRLLSKKEKLDEYKRMIFEHYMPIMIRMREQDIKQITASTVDGSGISLSSEGYMSNLVKYINVSKKDSSASSISNWTSDGFIKFKDVDIIPSTVSSSSRGISSPVLNDISGGLVSSASTVISGISSQSLREISADVQADDAEFKEQIYLRLLELQRLKQQIILKQQHALNQLDIEKEKPQRNGSHSDRSTLVQRQRIDESTLEWSSCNNYETPSRELSTQSWREFSSFSPASATAECVDGAGQPVSSRIQDSRLLRDQEIRADVLSDEMEPVKLEYGSSRSSINTSHSSTTVPNSSTNASSSTRGDRSVEADTRVPFQQELQILNDSIQRLASALKHNEPPCAVTAPSSGEKDTSTPSTSSSSGTSIPDMTQILKKFGLCWASSMIKKMDIAEKNNSSDEVSK